MKKLFLFLSIVMFCSLQIFAQTPYDNFAPEQSVKTMIELPQMQFMITNTDPNSEIRYILFDESTLSLNLLNDNGSLIGIVILNPNDKKFPTIDPLAEKYYNISPYAFCLNNPIKFIDPNGMDVWEINDKGEVINRIKDESQDAFYMVAKDADGKYQRTYTKDVYDNKHYNSVSFEYGTITDAKKAGRSKDATSFSITSEAAGADLFKFFADNTKVEFGLINTKDNGSTVMTNHKEGTVAVSMTAQKLSDKGQTITSIIHNHPNNTDPSGFEVGDKSGDKFAADKYLPNVERHVYQSQNNVLVMYDNKSIIGMTPWGLVFPSSVKRPPSVPIRRYPGVGLLPP